MGKVGQLVSGSLIFFWTAAVALAQAELHSAKTVRDLNVSDIFIPSDVGYVIETHPVSAAQAPILIHIQEAHANYEGQKHLATILEELVTRYGLKLILVEGGHGDVSLSYLRAYGPVDNRRQVAEKYLKAGILSGEEYLDIVSEYPLTLWGVEQEDLYQENVDAFLASESLAESLNPLLAVIHDAADELTSRLFPQSLIALEDKAKQFEAGDMTVAEYIAFLVSLASSEQISEATFPSLTHFRSAQALEQQLKQEDLKLEQATLTSQLTQKLDATQREGLRAKSRQVNAGELRREQFYADLEQLADGVGISLVEYPALYLYIRYLKTSAEIQPNVLSQELDQLATQLRRTLASTPQSQALQTLLGEVDLIEKLVDLRLSPEEYQRVQSLDIAQMTARWTRFLNEELPSSSQAVQALDGLTALESAVPQLQRFYEGVHRRDEVLVQNAMAKLTETHEPIAVLITGGFHSPQITRLLKDHGVGVLVVAPKVSHATDEHLYHAVLRYKSGHGTFDEVQAAVADHQFAEQRN